MKHKVQKVQKPLKVGDEVIVLHSSRKDKIKEVLNTKQGTIYRVFSTTLDYSTVELQRPVDFKGTIREAPPKRTRHITSTATRSTEEIPFTEIPESAILDSEKTENEISENTKPEFTESTNRT